MAGIGSIMLLNIGLFVLRLPVVYFLNDYFIKYKQFNPVVGVLLTVLLLTIFSLSITVEDRQTDQK